MTNYLKQKRQIYFTLTLDLEFPELNVEQREQLQVNALLNENQLLRNVGEVASWFCVKITIDRTIKILYQENKPSVIMCATSGIRHTY